MTFLPLFVVRSQLFTVHYSVDTLDYDRNLRVNESYGFSSTSY